MDTLEIIIAIALYIAAGSVAAGLWAGLTETKLSIGHFWHIAFGWPFLLVSTFVYIPVQWLRSFFN